MGNHQCGSRCSFDACHWKLFQHNNYGGHYNDMCYNGCSSQTYTGQGSWTNQQFKNGDVSSITLSSYGNKNCLYTLCKHSDGSGDVQ